jgi:hypothetical protein
MSTGADQRAELKFVVTNTLIVLDISARSLSIGTCSEPPCCVRASRHFFDWVTSG